MKKVDLYYDLVDRAAMIYHRSLKTDYLDSLLLAACGIIHEDYDSRLDDEDIKEMENICREIYSTEFLNEEVRLASQLLIAKAFKHIGYSLDLMTPDAVNYLIAAAVSHRFRNKKISILDTALGTGNLLQAICNRMDVDPDLFGIEYDWRLAQLARALANLQGNAIIIYYQDALRDLIEKVDLIIGDLDGYDVADDLVLGSKLYGKGVRYFPYLVIDARLRNLKKNGIFIYVVDNDFFSHPGAPVFREEIKKKATFLGVVTLPQSMFHQQHGGKSIFIGTNALKKNHQTIIMTINDTEKNTLAAAVDNIVRLVDMF